MVAKILFEDYDNNNNNNNNNDNIDDLNFGMKTTIVLNVNVVDKAQRFLDR
jgi:hypothetical protein